MKITQGRKYGLLTFTGNRIAHGSGRSRWYEFEVECICGNVKYVRQSNLSSGATTTCGCNGGVPKPGTKKAPSMHGMSKHPLYKQWKAMIRRCESPKQPQYKFYGGKGVKVCPEWRNDFTKYCAWAEDAGYSPGLELDRIDSDGDYCSDNCRWITKKANIRNRDLMWSDDIDARLVVAAKERGISPYEFIRQAVESAIG